MYACERWTTEKAECQRIDAFTLWCWRRLLSFPWTARRSVNPKGNQHWIYIGRTDVEDEASILWPPDANSRLIGKDPDAGKDWRQEEKRVTEERWLDGITDLMDMSLSKLLEISQRSRCYLATEHHLICKSQFIQQILTEQLLCAAHWEHSDDQSPNSPCILFRWHTDRGQVHKQTSKTITVLNF